MSEIVLTQRQFLDVNTARGDRASVPVESRRRFAFWTFDLDFPERYLYRIDRQRGVALTVRADGRPGFGGFTTEFYLIPLEGAALKEALDRKAREDRLAADEASRATGGRRRGSGNGTGTAGGSAGGGGISVGGGTGGGSGGGSSAQRIMGLPGDERPAAVAEAVAEDPSLIDAQGVLVDSLRRALIDGLDASEITAEHLALLHPSDRLRFRIAPGPYGPTYTLAALVTSADTLALNQAPPMNSPTALHHARTTGEPITRAGWIADGEPEKWLIYSGGAWLIGREGAWEIVTSSRGETPGNLTDDDLLARDWTSATAPLITLPDLALAA